MRTQIAILALSVAAAGLSLPVAAHYDSGVAFRISVHSGYDHHRPHKQTYRHGRRGHHGHYIHRHDRYCPDYRAHRQVRKAHRYLHYRPSEIYLQYGYERRYRH